MDDRQNLKVGMEIEVSLKERESIKRLVDVLYDDIVSKTANIFMGGETAKICFQGTSMPRQEVIDVLREFDGSVKDKPVKKKETKKEVIDVLREFDSSVKDKPVNEEETKKEVDGGTPEEKKRHNEYRFNRNSLRSNIHLKLEDVPILKEYADKASSYEEFIQMILDYLNLKPKIRDLYLKIIEVAVELLKERDYVLFPQVMDKMNEEKEIITQKDYQRLAAAFSYRKIKGFMGTTMLIARCANYNFSSKNSSCSDSENISKQSEKDMAKQPPMYVPNALNEVLKTLDNQKDKLDKAKYIMSQMGINDELTRKVILFGITTEFESDKAFWKEVTKELKVDKFEVEAKVSSQINSFMESNGEKLIKAFDFIQLLKRTIC